MQRVGIRELGQNLSVDLHRVREGESFEVTDRDQPVAALVARPEGGVLGRLVSDGELHAPETGLDGLAPPVPVPGVRLADAVEDEREERLSARGWTGARLRAPRPTAGSWPPPRRTG